VVVRQFGGELRLDRRVIGLRQNPRDMRDDRDAAVRRALPAARGDAVVDLDNDRGAFNRDLHCRFRRLPIADLAFGVAPNALLTGRRGYHWLSKALMCIGGNRPAYADNPH
jgi:hypothetical protein